MPGSFRIARVLGIDVRVHVSWLLIFLLVTLSLADQVFPFSYPTWSQQKTIIVATITALLFFGSVVLHEFAHALVALRFRIPVSSITLFLLGGVASLTREPPSARSEFFMAIAGPATSLVIGAASLGVAELATEALEIAPGLQPVEAVAGYLGYVNIAVAVFNLIPGFPLDGGRVLRSILWGARNDRVGATRVAARAGQIVAGLFVLWAGYRIFTGDPGGLWMALIAYFLYGAATQTLQQERVVRAVGTTRAAQLMSTDVHAVPVGTSIGALVREHMLPLNLRAAPIADAFGRFAGLISIGDLRKVEQERWPGTPVEQVMIPASELPAVHPDDELATTLDKFGEAAALLPVVDAAGVLVGLLHREAVLDYVRMRELLGLEDRR